MSQPSPRRSRRPRDPAASRSAILIAARDCFAEFGYDRATVREIARRADASTGLVLRHFGTKRELFLAALADPSVSVDAPTDDGGGDDFVGQLVASLRAGSADPFLALLRSAPTNPEAAGALRSAVAERVTSGRAAARLQVDLVGSVLIGATFVRQILGSSPLAACSDDEFATLLEPPLRAAWEAGADARERTSSAPRSASRRRGQRDRSEPRRG